MQLLQVMLNSHSHLSAVAPPAAGSATIATRNPRKCTVASNRPHHDQTTSWGVWNHLQSTWWGAGYWACWSWGWIVFVIVIVNNNCWIMLKLCTKTAYDSYSKFPASILQKRLDVPDILGCDITQVHHCLGGLVARQSCCRVIELYSEQTGPTHSYWPRCPT